MLNSSARPRAPSVATLKILYQLAYISSGTALGVGALCAEERRRRTQVVQKIADNAKRLRQNSRYNHRAALAVADAHVDYEVLGYESDRFRSQKRAFLAPELPTVIDSAYGHSPGRAWKPATKLNRRKGSDLFSLDANIEVSPREAQREPYRREYYKPPIPVRPAQERVNQHSLKLQTAVAATPTTAATARPSMMLSPTQSITPPTTQSQVTELVTHSPAERTNSKIVRFCENVRKAGDTTSTSNANVQYSFSSRRYWDRSFNHPRWQQATEAEIDEAKRCLSYDVAHFFQVVSERGRQHSITIDQADDIARALSKLAAQFGYLRDATSLLLWKIAVDRVRDEDIGLLNKCWTRFSTQNGSWDILRPDGKPSHGLPPIGHTSPAKPFKAGAHGKVYRALTEQCGLHWRLPHLDVVKSTARYCRDLANGGFLGAAVHVMTAVPYDKWTSTPVSLISDLFSLAVRSAQLSLCDMILRWTGGTISNDLISKTAINDFIRTCGNKKHYGILRAVFTSKDYSCAANTQFLRTNDILDATSYMQLCLACMDKSTNLTIIYQTCFDRLPREQQDDLTIRRSRQLVSEMMDKWTTTRNFQLVLDDYARRIQRLENKTSSTVLQILHLTMIRICLAAGRLQTAEEALSRVESSGVDMETRLVTMLVRAHQKDWTAVDALLQTIGKTSPSATPHLDVVIQVLKLYVKQHTSAECLDFAVCLFEAVHHTPKQSTTTILLQKCVEEQCLPMMTKWFETCRQRNWQIKLDAGLVSVLLHKHFVTFRTNHTMIMGTAHTLSRSAPELVDQQVQSVIEEAASYDMRKYRQAHTQWTRVNASKRLYHLSQSSDFVPLPGKAWNQVLKLREPRKPNKEYSSRTRIAGGRTKHTKIEAEQGVLLEAQGKSENTLSTVSSEADSYMDDDIWIKDFDGEVPKTEDDTFTSMIAGLAVQGAQRSADAFELPVEADTNVNIGRGTADTSASGEISARSGRGSAKSLKQQTRLRSTMMLAMANHDYEHVLRLYQDCCDSDGMPSWPLALEIALESSLRLHESDTRHAEHMLRQAEAAGVNTATMMGPLLMHRLKSLSVESERDAKAITTSVMDYYRLNEENGRHNNHHIAVATANKLIDNNLARHGVRLLESLYLSQPNILDAVTASTWIKGYIALDDPSGIFTIVDRVLQSKIRIDQMLVNGLEIAQFAPWVLVKTPMQLFSEAAQVKLKECRQLCAEMKRMQRQEMSCFLPRFASLLIEFHRQMQDKQAWHSGHCGSDVKTKLGVVEKELSQQVIAAS